MKFISAPEFLNLPIAIQEVFLKWWKPTIGDLFTTKKVHAEIDVVVNTLKGEIYGMNSTFKSNINSSVDTSLEPFPLLIEGQLREFIEDMTNGIIDITFDAFEGGYKFEIWSKEGLKRLDNSEYANLGTDLLHAYWKLALKIFNQTK